MTHIHVYPLDVHAPIPPHAHTVVIIYICTYISTIVIKCTTDSSTELYRTSCPPRPASEQESWYDNNSVVPLVTMVLTKLKLNHIIPNVEVLQTGTHAGALFFCERRSQRSINLLTVKGKMLITNLPLRLISCSFSYIHVNSGSIG